MKCKSFDNNITTLNIKWTFASLLTVYSSPFWPLQCQCLLFIKSGRFITHRLANNLMVRIADRSYPIMQPEEGHDLILYFSFDENNPPNWKKSVSCLDEVKADESEYKANMPNIVIFGITTTCNISKLSQLYHNFEIWLVLFMPNITTNHAVTYTSTVVSLFPWVIIQLKGNKN